MTNAAAPEHKKKGLHPLAWVAIGCAGVLVIGGIVAVLAGMFLFGKARQFTEEMQENPALATAKLIAAANPEIELVGEDEANQTVTFRNVKSGEELTVGYKDIQEGKITFASGDEQGSIDFDGGERDEGRMTITTDEGTASFGAGVAADDLPGWLPVYPGTNPTATYSSNTPEMRGGAYTAKTTDDLEQVVSFYADELAEAGLEIAQRMTTAEGAILIAAATDESRTCTVTASVEQDELQIMVNFAERTQAPSR